jgi:hypothetical protein
VKREGFKVAWQIDDGYIGKDRPHSFYVAADDLDDDMSEEEIRKTFSDMLQEEFESNASPTTEDEEAFVEWAKQQLAQRGAAL